MFADGARRPARRRKTANAGRAGALRQERAGVERKRGLVVADYEPALSEGDLKARIVLEVVAKIDIEVAGLDAEIANAEAVLAEWQKTAAVELDGVRQRLGLPAVLESEDAGARRHRIEDQSRPVAPAADDAVLLVLAEAPRPKLGFELVERG